MNINTNDPILYMYLFYLTLAVMFLGSAILIGPSLKRKSSKEK